MLRLLPTEPDINFTTKRTHKFRISYSQKAIAIHIAMCPTDKEGDVIFTRCDFHTTLY